ncbi:MAG: Uma2 family endonuclease [Chromatiaceae bacterium]|nr:Uma2 family endonuclease [Chromatiaceae bacterium]
MPSPAEDLIRRHRFTVTDYYRMAEDGILAPDARVELIDGEVLEMPPIGPLHASVVTEIQDLLTAAVRGRAVVRVQNPVHLGPHDEPQPDIALVKPPTARYRTRHPEPQDILLLVEVADTSLRVDRDLKLGVYRDQPPPASERRPVPGIGDPERSHRCRGPWARRGRRRPFPAAVGAAVD